MLVIVILNIYSIMPELPEVETVCRGLRPYFEKKSFKKVMLRRSNLRFEFDNNFCKKLAGKAIDRVIRRGKYIIIKINSCNYSLVWHLGMSGRVIILSANDLPKDYDKHEHVIFETCDGVQVRFRDPRRFGFMKIIDNSSIEESINLGVEPFSREFTAEHLYNKLKNKSQSIKTVLLDQRIIAGLGNIYVCEALFATKINPLVIAKQLSLTELQLLIKNILIILEKAIQAGGSSLKDHAQVNGEMGYFQHQFKVYNRAKEFCTTCKKVQIKRVIQQGRSSFYCPECQNN